MPIRYVMRPDGFLAGDTDTGVAVFAYVSSPHCSLAKLRPAHAARVMIDRETGGRVHPDAIASQDRLMGQLLADPAAAEAEPDPACVPPLPRKGAKITVRAHGRVLLVARNGSGKDWHAVVARRRTAYDGGDHVRFGNRAEITADVKHFIATGTLPGRPTPA